VPLTEGDRLDVIPSEVDPDYECVRLGSTIPDGTLATPPPGGRGSEGSRLCPEGYAPRRRRKPYRAEGKRAIREGTPGRHPGSSD
jgi:hypothetical protein